MKMKMKETAAAAKSTKLENENEKMEKDAEDKEIEVDTSIRWTHDSVELDGRATQMGYAIFTNQPTSTTPLVKQTVWIDPTWSVATDTVKFRDDQGSGDAISIVRHRKKGAKIRSLKFHFPMTDMIHLITTMGKIREAMLKRAAYKNLVTEMLDHHRKYGPGNNIEDDSRYLWNDIKDHVDFVSFHFHGFDVYIKDFFYPSFRKGIDVESIRFCWTPNFKDRRSITIPVALCNPLLEALLYLAKLNKINCRIRPPSPVSPPQLPGIFTHFTSPQLLQFTCKDIFI